MSSVPLNTQSDILLARSAGRDLAKRLGFGVADQTRLATAISELCRNAINYAVGGVCTISTSRQDPGRRTVLVVVADRGPGIADVEMALQPGYSSGRGLGQGLSVVRRLMDDLTIETSPSGSTLQARMSRGS